MNHRRQALQLCLDGTVVVIVRVVEELIQKNAWWPFGKGDIGEGLSGRAKEIETLLWSKGCHNRNDGRIAHSTMEGIICNHKYRGCYVGNKVEVIDMFTKKQKLLPWRSG